MKTKRQLFKIDHSLWGGEHPGIDVSNIPAGITCFFDLTTFENAKYKNTLSCRQNYFRFPIMDRDVPSSFNDMHDIIIALCSELEKGEKIYLHCHGGRGRTGTVAACYFAYRYDLDGVDSLLRLGMCYRGCLKDRLGLPIPETLKQTAFIILYAAWLKICKSIAQGKALGKVE